MSSHHEELQEIENIKHLWRNGGKVIVGLLLVAALGYLGYNVYGGQVHKNNLAVAWQASQINGDMTKLAAIQQQHSHNPATTQATLETAKTLFDSGKLDEAEKAYRWVLTNNKAPVFQAAAMTNLATILLQQKKYDDALKVLHMPIDAAYQNIINEMRGDVFAAQGKTQEARQSYQSVLEKLPEDSNNRQLIQLKIEQL